MSYLKIDTVEFKKTEEHNLHPSAVLPSTELMQQAERSLDGTMHIDITAVKRKLIVVFDMMEKKDFDYLRGVIKIENPAAASDGLVIEYFDTDKDGKDKNKDNKFFVEGFAYTPFIVEDKIMWSNVTVTFAEI